MQKTGEEESFVPLFSPTFPPPSLFHKDTDQPHLPEAFHVLEKREEMCPSGSFWGGNIVTVRLDATHVRQTSRPVGLVEVLDVCGPNRLNRSAFWICTLGVNVEEISVTRGNDKDDFWGRKKRFSTVRKLDASILLQIHIESREILLKLLEVGNVRKSQQISGNFPNPSSSHKAEPNLKYEAAEVNKERLLRSAVAYARSPEIMQKLHGYFTMDGVSRCFPRPMGGTYISSLFGNFITLDNSSYKKLKFDPGKVLIIVLVHGSVLVELYGWDINGSICGIKVTEEPCLEINACWVEKKKAADSWAGRYNNPSSSDDYSSLKVESHKYTEKSQGGMFKEIRERM
ncbi:hypothetical protein NC651_007705 [Populus alba x Populus x berolinensis]|nr:hypothetical protein NC651_007705 [Populus alba x Populus x berolinensis]